jgi:hypothetical protein
MKKIFLFLSVFFILGITNSCLTEKIYDVVDEPPVVPPPPPPPVTPKDLNLITSVESTNLRLKSFNSEKIGFFVTKNSQFLLDNKDISLTNGKATFTTNLSDSIVNCFAYYPYQTVTNGILSGNLSSSQNQEMGTSASADYMPAEISNLMLLISNQAGDINYYQKDVNLEFRNVFSYICFAIIKDNSVTRFNNQKIKEFEMYISDGVDTINASPNKKLFGDYTIDLNQASQNAVYTPVFSSGATSRLVSTVTNSLFIDSDAARFIWITVPPFSLTNEKIVIKMKTQDDNGNTNNTFSTISNLANITRNTITYLDVVLNKNNIESNEIDPTSLENKLANSYIISDIGKFSIPVKKVNGEKIEGGVSATWLWASKEGGSGSFDIEDLIYDISYNSGNDSIVFNIGNLNNQFIKGNVILALKDASDNILWTWHLWLTDKPDDIEYINFLNTPSIFLLDRNIGALSSDVASLPVNSYGFLYQWGRKDPFFGGDGALSDEGNRLFLTAKQNTVINKASAWATGVNDWIVNEGLGNETQAIQNPMTFYTNNSVSEGAITADWNSGTNDLWVRKTDNFKSDQDPCPYGYRVPSKDELGSLHKASENGGYFKYEGGLFWEYYYPGTNANLYLLATGRRQGRSTSSDGIGGQLKFTGTNSTDGRLYYWTCSPIDVDEIKFDGGSHVVSSRGNTLYSEDDFGDNADAYSVRCVKYTP